MSEQFLRAVARGNLAFVQKALEDDASLVHLNTEDGSNGINTQIKGEPNMPLEGPSVPLLVAASAGHLEIVKALLAKGADMKYQTVHGDNAMDCALKARKTDVYQGKII